MTQKPTRILTKLTTSYLTNPGPWLATGIICAVLAGVILGLVQ